VRCRLLYLVLLCRSVGWSVWLHLGFVFGLSLWLSLSWVYCVGFGGRRSYSKSLSSLQSRSSFFRIRDHLHLAMAIVPQLLSRIGHHWHTHTHTHTHKNKETLVLIIDFKSPARHRHYHHLHHLHPHISIHPAIRRARHDLQVSSKQTPPFPSSYPSTAIQTPFISFLLWRYYFFPSPEKPSTPSPLKQTNKHTYMHTNACFSLYPQFPNACPPAHLLSISAVPPPQVSNKRGHHQESKERQKKNDKEKKKENQFSLFSPKRPQIRSDVPRHKVPPFAL